MTLRWLSRLLAFVLLLAPVCVRGEKPGDLPVPTTHVNDFAHVLSDSDQARIEDLCREVHDQAGADIDVVTIKTLDDGQGNVQTIEDFASRLEEHWKIGQKGSDRGLIVVLSLDPRRMWVEVGYGLEGILNDAKVGRILDPAVPYAHSGDYGTALMTVVQGVAGVIAADKGVTLTPIQHQYHRQTVQQGIGPGQIILVVVGIIVFLILVRTGHAGMAFWLLLNMMGGGGGNGGGGGGGWGNDDRGGGGGSGGGSSGGGGAGRDF